jgi:hypothetical protein
MRVTLGHNSQLTIISKWVDWTNVRHLKSNLVCQSGKMRSHLLIEIIYIQLRTHGFFNPFWEDYLSAPLIWIKIKHGGLDLSQCGLNQDSRPWHWQKVSLDNQEVSIKIKKSWLCLNTIFQSQKSQSRLINLSRPEIFGRSWSIVSLFYHISQSRFFNFSRFLSLKYLKKSQ